MPVTPRPLLIGADGRLDGAPLLGDPRILRVLDLLDRDGEEARVVGGAVRNALLGLPPGDIDVATTARPEAVVARAKAAKMRAIPTGIEHGTVTLLSGGLPVEVTTLREDVETDGRHAVVRFGRDFARDAERRDFTMNALSAGRDGAVHDHTGGVADLAAGRVRFIGEAATRISEDHLRILRFFRFHATYGVGPLDPEGLAAAAAGRAGLDRLSRERVRGETMKLLAAPGAAAVLQAMHEVDRHRGGSLLEQILGGPADMDRAQAAGPDGDPVLRLMMLAMSDEASVERLRDRLRLSNAERDRMLDALRAARRDEMASCASAGLEPGEALVRALLFDHGRRAALDALHLAKAASTDPARWDAALSHAENGVRPEMPFTGRDILAYGLKGPEVGKALELFRAAYRRAGFPSDEAVRRTLLADAASGAATGD